MLRDGALVDLFKVVRRAVRVSQRSYSIKYLEPLYMPTGRIGGVATATASIEAYEHYLAAVAAGKDEAAAEILASIGDYNEYDCVSTHRLLHWLLGVRDSNGITPAPTFLDGPDDDLAARRAEQQLEEELAAVLTALVRSAEGSTRGNGQGSRKCRQTIAFARIDLTVVPR